ncbi:cupin [Streptomyces sp. DHE17-7]|uniref:cupin n=1 Tax=Streptomyces sp. DHE17-7 TaxID=2759949 RepID=UPI0022EAE100|nr:cupin [Streptomyces sp. DHE17-7]MBJ6622888.1 cupin [Streptomyces sp. DHE17-7]
MLEAKTLDKPDERRDFPRGHIEAVHMEGLDFAVATFEPGWRWSESVAPIAGTDSCMIHHNCYVVEGRMHVRMDDEQECAGPATWFVCHRQRRLGLGERCVLRLAGGMAKEYAKAD